MGVFDNIKFEIACPVCGEQTTGFQSKSGFPSGKALEFWEVDEFHTSCQNCKTWIEYTFSADKVQRRSIGDYTLVHFPLPESVGGLNSGIYFTFLPELQAP